VDVEFDSVLFEQIPNKKIVYIGGIQTKERCHLLEHAENDDSWYE
jgi:hypothetical protein